MMSSLQPGLGMKKIMSETCDNVVKSTKQLKVCHIRHQNMAMQYYFQSLAEIKPCCDQEEYLHYPDYNILMESISGHTDQCFTDFSQVEKIYVVFKDVIGTYSNNPEKFYAKFYRIQLGSQTDFEQKCHYNPWICVSKSKYVFS